MWKRLTIVWTLLRRDGRDLWHALRHPAAPRWLKVGTGLVLLYVLSPIDLVPDALPVLGALDDLLLVPFAIRAMLKRLPPEILDGTKKPRGF